MSNEGVPTSSEIGQIQQQIAEDAAAATTDERDPIHGPAIARIHEILETGVVGPDADAFIDDLAAFQQEFLKHFGDHEARRYRLFHTIIGSTPPRSADLFDAEGEWSVARRMAELARQHGINPEQV